MGGSGGGGFFKRSDPDAVKAELRREEARTLDQEFETDVAEQLGELLADANTRDASAIGAALEDIKRALEADIEGSVDPIFGGSVRKHTYVDGLSDVDALLILRDEALRSMSPTAVLEYFEKVVRDDLPGWEVSRGRLAVTLTKAGLQVQILPAVRTEGLTRIPDAAGQRWSEINPEAFFRKLTATNGLYGGKVVPTIKLAKIINAQEPQARQMTGYHIESLAIEAFKTYDGPLNPKAMLEHLIGKARDLVLTPIRDKTGQSVHVDEYLGPAKSANRKAISAGLDRVYREMKNADALRLKAKWLELLGEE